METIGHSRKPSLTPPGATQTSFRLTCVIVVCSPAYGLLEGRDSSFQSAFPGPCPGPGT